MPRNQRGVTLIELMIAITLVAAISVGLLFAMRTSVLAYEKVNQRLAENRRAITLQQTLERQVGSVIPARADCAFAGGPQQVRFLSSYSLAEGARGYPRLVQYAVAPDPNGGVRLIMNEYPYLGTCLSTAAPPESVEVAGRLAYCRMLYRAGIPDSPLAGDWRQSWTEVNLPRALRIELAPLEATRLPVLSLSLPLHVTREVAFAYDDQ